MTAKLICYVHRVLTLQLDGEDCLEGLEISGNFILSYL